MQTSCVDSLLSSTQASHARYMPLTVVHSANLDCNYVEVRLYKHHCTIGTFRGMLLQETMC